MGVVIMERNPHLGIRDRDRDCPDRWQIPAGVKRVSSNSPEVVTGWIGCLVNWRAE
jgi:hypothetical protein